MARPAPKILLDRTFERPIKGTKKVNWIKEELVSATGLYAVVYEGIPFGLRESSALIDSPPKYKKTTFVNPGHAYLLVDKLNKHYHTDKFAVVELVPGDIIAKESDDTLEL